MVTTKKKQGGGGSNPSEFSSEFSSEHINDTVIEITEILGQARYSLGEKSKKPNPWQLSCPFESNQKEKKLSDSLAESKLLSDSVGKKAQ